jgi:general secretion pathway protein F
MSPYRYRAARSDGGIVSGVVEAASADQAASVLADRGLYPVGLEVAADSDEPRRAASRRDLAIVFESLASLVGAGVSLERAIGASEAVSRGALRETLAAARTALREGQSFSHALAASRGVIPPVVLGMIRAGERGSELPAALEQVARHLEQEADLVARVRQALAYPLLLAVAGTASVLVIGTVIVPRFAELLGDLGQDLPLATRLLLTGSRILSRFWPAAVGLGAALVWGISAWLKRPDGRKTRDDALLALPVVGRVRQALATARIARALGGMLRAGMPLLPGLDAAREAAGDLGVAARIARARERVSAGASLTGSLEREAVLIPAALQLFAVGEASGRLGEMALRAGDLAAQDAERGLKTLVTLVEPALIVLFGGLVAFVAAALLQAVYSLRPGVG